MDNSEVIEMDGVLVAWDGKCGTIHAQGIFIPVHQHTLKRFGFTYTPNVGDRVLFTARRKVEMTFNVDKVRLMAYQESRQADALAYRAWRRRDGLAVEEREGTVESFDKDKGIGFIKCSDGETVLLHVTVLRAAGVKDDVVVGTHISFEALWRPKGIQAFRIRTIDVPQ